MITLSDEQQVIVDEVVAGNSVYVDACIGSGKTTLLKHICGKLPLNRILYLTFNKLLKEDAKKKITNFNVEVHNYHGFAFKYLKQNNLPYTNERGIEDLIKYVRNGRIKLPTYDTILVDEIQDINENTSQLLLLLNELNRPQLVIVGDMKQKIYDNTSLDVLNDCVFKMRKDFVQLDLTNCFRINKGLADELGFIWEKDINGVNKNCSVRRMRYDEDRIINILNSYENKDILILTPFRNSMYVNDLVNNLEKKYPDKYNKTNLYITISDMDSMNRPVNNSMIVTTYDGSKGLERPLSIVFGYDTGTLGYRSSRGSKEIIRNLYLVAASRGKREIIFIETDEEFLTKENFTNSLFDKIEEERYRPSTMFDFKYDEDIRRTYSFLEMEEINGKESEIQVIDTDFNIALSPAIGVYQEAIFFKNWSFETKLMEADQREPLTKYVQKMHENNAIPSLKKQVLCLTAIDTKLARYIKQAKIEFINSANEKALLERLGSRLDPNTEIQKGVFLKTKDFTVSGYIDAVQDNVPYELKFVQELEMRHFLQLATYLYLGQYYEGILWNTRTNQAFKVRIKDRKGFWESVIKTIRRAK